MKDNPQWLDQMLQKIKILLSTRRNVFLISFAPILMMFGYLWHTKPEQLQRANAPVISFLSELNLPVWLREPIYKAYCWKYSVRAEDIPVPFNSFPTFSSFFTRKIFPREVPSDDQLVSVCSPCDGKVLSVGEVRGDECVIVKGATYKLGQLLFGEKYEINQELLNELLEGGNSKLYQVVLYLSPGDYHRFHAPTNFEVRSKKDIEGDTWSVNQKSIVQRPNVYARNARVCLQGKWKHGYMGTYHHMQVKKVGFRYGYGWGQKCVQNQYFGQKIVRQGIRNRIFQPWIYHCVIAANQGGCQMASKEWGQCIVWEKNL